MRRSVRGELVLTVVLAGCSDVSTAPDVRAYMRLDAPALAVAPDQFATFTRMVTIVQSWVGSGVLNTGQGDALIVKINAARAAMARGSHNLPAAAGILQALTNQVQSFVQAGLLTSGQAVKLVALGQAVTNNELLFESISAGSGFACGLAVGGYAYCWGRNDAGQLGNGSTTATVHPTLVATGQTFTSIGVGEWHGCGLTALGEAWCWGGNISGQVGDGTTIDRLVPSRVLGGYVFTSLDLGAYSTCGTTTSGAAYCWGAGGRVGVDVGGLGAPSPAMCAGYYAGPWPCSPSPVQVSGGFTFSSVSAGLWAACGLAAGGQPLCWGWNQLWQLGNGTTVNAPSPTPVATSVPFQSIAIGAAHACGIASGGAAYCWGPSAFNSGQLGNGTFLGASVPSPVSGGLTFGMVRPAKGNNIFSFTCGVTTGGVAYCWGANVRGELGGVAAESCNSGVFPFSCSSTPIAVSGGHIFDEVSAGNAFACGVTPVGEGYCWGANDVGQLGDGSTTDASAPVRVVR